MQLFSRFCFAVFIACVCAGCGPSASSTEYVDLQKALKSSEERLNAAGKVERKTYPPGTAWALNLQGATIDDQVIEDITTLDRVSELILSGSTITDEQMQTLLQSDKTGYLNVLDISNTGVTDAGLEGLEGKKYLQKINIQGSQVTEEFLTSVNGKRNGNSEIRPMFRTIEITK